MATLLLDSDTAITNIDRGRRPDGTLSGLVFALLALLVIVVAVYRLRRRRPRPV